MRMAPILLSYLVKGVSSTPPEWDNKANLDNSLAVMLNQLGE
jgi:hypothetical protein